MHSPKALWQSLVILSCFAGFLSPPAYALETDAGDEIPDADAVIPEIVVTATRA